MIRQAKDIVLYTAIITSLVLVDYALGNGFVDMLHRTFCRIFCFVKKTIKKEMKIAQAAGPPTTLNIPMVLMEMVTLTITMVLLNIYKKYRSKDRIDELLIESKDALRQTNEFLEKWRVRRINWQAPSEGSYLDEEPQPIKPFNLEVPILHMAIVDTLGTTRRQPERGDAGEAINITDSTLLSVTSLLDNEDLRASTDSIADNGSEEAHEDTKNIEFRNRYLWDVMEEDSDPDD